MSQGTRKEPGAKKAPSFHYYYKKEKKQMNDDFRNLPAIVQIFAIVALVAAIYVIVLNEFQDTTLTNVTVTNDSITSTILGTAIDVNAGTSTYFIGIFNATLAVANSTTILAPSGNVSVISTEGVGATITFLPTGIAQNNTEYNVSFVYSQGSAARDQFGDGITGISEITSWLDLIGLIIAASIIMYLVLRNFGIIGGSGKGNAGQGY